MTTGSQKHAAPGAGRPGSGGAASGASGAGKPGADEPDPGTAAAKPAPGESNRGDAYVDRLGDRLSKETDLPEDAGPAPVVVPPPPGRSFPAMHETSDIRTLPSSSASPGLEDDALDMPPPPEPGNTSDAFAEFEDELEGETTRIDDSHLLAEASTAILENPPGQPFLLVEKGADEGREFVLQDGENGVGRGIDNDVILADVAVSRRHMRIIREGNELILKDLGSGNGTQLNGKKVSTATLAEGDRIELGETTLVVRTPGASFAAHDPRAPDANTDESHLGGSLPPPAMMGTPSDPFAIPNGPGYSPELTPSDTLAPHSRPPPKTGAIVLPRPVFVAILLAGALLLAMFGAAVALLALRASQEDEPDAVTLVDADSAYDRGVRAYQAHQWDEAEGAFREAIEEGENPRATDYLGRIAQARTHARSIAQARAALESGDDNRAISLATSVPEDSPLASEARRVAQQGRTAQVRTHIEAGRRALLEGDREGARARLGQARNIDAQSALVRAFENEIQMRTGEDVAAEAEAEAVAEAAAEEEAAEAEEDADDARPSAATRGRRGPRRGRPSRGSRRGRSVDRSAIVTPYLAGDFARAASTARSLATSANGADRNDLTTLAGRIERFGSLWRRVSSARFAASVRPQMEQAMALDRQIARNGQYRDRMRPHVVSAYLADARRQRSNPVGSCSAVRQALRVDARNPEARQMASGCEAQARGMMIEARNAPPARAMGVYGRVLLMVPPSSSVYREASSRRAQLGRRTAVDEDE